LLTLRQIQILNLVKIGLTNKQIADKLRISEDTVKAHRRNICEKLDIRGTNGLLIWILKENP